MSLKSSTVTVFSGTAIAVWQALQSPAPPVSLNAKIPAIVFTFSILSSASVPANTGQAIKRQSNAHNAPGLVAPISGGLVAPNAFFILSSLLL